jgi:hypothetical protein
MDQNSPTTAADPLGHVWRYFQLHAEQRMALFNFFLVISASMIAAMAACLQLGRLFNLIGTVIGLLLFLVAFIFAKIG